MKEKELPDKKKRMILKAAYQVKVKARTVTDLEDRIERMLNFLSRKIDRTYIGEVRKTLGPQILD